MDFLGLDFCTPNGGLTRGGLGRLASKSKYVTVSNENVCIPRCYIAIAQFPPSLHNFVARSKIFKPTEFRSPLGDLVPPFCSFGSNYGLLETKPGARMRCSHIRFTQCRPIVHHCAPLRDVFYFCTPCAA